MLRHDIALGKVDLDRLMDLAATARELTEDPRSFAQIPAFLKAVLGIDGVMFAVVRVAKGEERVVTLVLPIPQGANPELELEIIGLAQRAESAAEPELWRENLVIRRDVNATHRMLVLVHARIVAETGGTLQVLQLLSTHIAKSIGSTLAWLDSPATLGDPFDKLTEREWVVLCGLNSEDGEKQLADRLGLSPHTLHSHIKAIYRKVGVQGRLPLLQNFHRAQREYRLRVLAGGLGASLADRVAG